MIRQAAVVFIAAMLFFAGNNANATRMFCLDTGVALIVDDDGMRPAGGCAGGPWLIEYKVRKKTSDSPEARLVLKILQATTPEIYRKKRKLTAEESRKIKTMRPMKKNSVVIAIEDLPKQIAIKEEGVNKF